MSQEEFQTKVLDALDNFDKRIKSVTTEVNSLKEKNKDAGDPDEEPSEAEKAKYKNLL